MKPRITVDEINKFYGYINLKRKTQMIRNIPPVKSGFKKRFLNRMSHTELVRNIAIQIFVEKRLYLKGVDASRLECSALLHDVGHTPYGHAGEDAINSLFLTKDGKYYSNKSAGTFKHNVYSIKLISDYFRIDYKNDKDLILIDSILKHGSTFPKQYNFLRFNDKDILKQNYVLDKSFMTKSKLLKDFETMFVTSVKNCESFTNINICQNPSCHYCKCDSVKKNNLCHASFKNSKDYKRSMYLSYPYPLTCEGTILYWADELAGLCGDLRDLFYFAKKYVHSKTADSILFEGIKSSITLLKGAFGSHKIITTLEDCIRGVESKRFYNFDKVLLDLNNENSLINYLIKKLNTRNIKNNDIQLNITKKRCDLLFKLTKTDFSIYKALKTKIYSDIHSYGYIKAVNKVAAKRIEEISNLFMNDINLFLKAHTKYKRGNRKVSKELFARSLYSILNLRKDGVHLDIFVSDFNKQFNSRGPVISLTEDSLKASCYLKKYFSNNNCIKVIQFFEREILHFIATFKESEIEKYYKSGLIGITPENTLPKNYN